jgi:YjgF/chorismate_mutase-like, putative endoribonuclease
MVPVSNSGLEVAGRSGAERSADDGKRASRLAALNALAVAKHELGSLDRSKRVAVAQLTTVDFTEHPEVADGAPEINNSLFARDQSHERSVSGAYSAAHRLHEISQC